MTKSEAVSLLMNSQYYEQGYKQGGSDVLDKIKAEIEQLRNFRAENYDLEQYCDCFDARIIFRDEVFEIIDRYRRESKGGN